MQKKDQLNFNFKSISIERAKELYRNYKTRIAPVITEKQDEIQRTHPYQSTEYTWISLEELKDYVGFLEEVEKLNDKRISGVAINFGAYDENEDFSHDTSSPPRKGDYRGRETLFFTPTFLETGEDYSNLSNHKPFYITSTDSENKYIGDFKALDYDSHDITSENDVSLSANEINTSPPLSS